MLILQKQEVQSLENASTVWKYLPTTLTMVDGLINLCQKRAFLIVARAMLRFRHNPRSLDILACATEVSF